MNKAEFYIIFHANLAFSSIEYTELANVIDKAYFPLLEVIEKTGIKTGIEMSGYTLEKIKILRPKWIKKFKELCEYGIVELVGSGYMQIIGPLVPYEINIKNQVIGLNIYREILGIIPQIAFVNEQVFSRSMVDLYSEAGYKAIAMEWNNAYSIKREQKWKNTYAFNPVVAQGVDSQIPMLWTDTILFQQFQRAAHAQISKEEYLKVVQKHIEKGYKSICIYSSDLEIFNYRPGRFETEAIIRMDEWKNIENILKEIKKFGNFILPHKILKKNINTKIKLNLTTASDPILVKKQDKYSLSRWAACGRGANKINTLCYNYFTNEKNKDIKKLLQFWGSDYRTHTTLKKWKEALKFFSNQYKNFLENELASDMVLERNKDSIVFEKDKYKIIFNTSKGLTLDRVYRDGKRLQFGTVRHGELDYINNSADFYTGTSTIESLLIGKITDLRAVENYNIKTVQKNIYKISSTVKLDEIAHEEKSWIINLNNRTITLDIRMNLKREIKGSIRLGTLTLLPQDKNSNFWYECKNGGKSYERFFMEKDDINIEHHKSKSLLQSSSGGLGVTNGILRFGIDSDIICEIDIDRAYSSTFVMLQNSCDYEKYLTRVYFGVQELDDTSKPYDHGDFLLKYSIKI